MPGASKVTPSLSLTLRSLPVSGLCFARLFRSWAGRSHSLGWGDFVPAALALLCSSRFSAVKVDPALLPTLNCVLVLVLLIHALSSPSATSLDSCTRTG